MSEIQGKITVIGEVKKGTSKAGKDWQSLQFVVETDEQYNNVYPMELFGSEKIDNFMKYNKVGQLVDCKFNISASKWQDKYFVKLACWSVFGVKTTAATPHPNTTEKQAPPF